MALVLTSGGYFLVKTGVICKAGYRDRRLRRVKRAMLRLLPVEYGELWGAPCLGLR